MPEPTPRQKLSVPRRIAVTVGIIIMVWSGGCSVLGAGFLIFLGGAHNASLAQLLPEFQNVFLYGGILFAVGLLLWGLAARLGR